MPTRSHGKSGAVAEANKAGKTYEPVTYEGAAHGFMRLGEAPEPTTDDAAKKQAMHDTYMANVKARTDAWARWKGLLSGGK